MSKRKPTFQPPRPVFYLTGKGWISVRFSYEGTRLSLSTQNFIKAEEWDKKRQCPKSSIRGRTDLVTLKAKLAEWENAIISLYQDVNGTLSPEQFRQEILYRVGAEERPGDMPKGLHEYLQAFIDNYKKRPGTSRTSWGKFESLQNHLLQFERDTKTNLSFEVIDFRFKERFSEWMFAPPRSFANNQAAKMMAALRQVMRDGFRKNVHGNRIQEDPAFIIRRIATQNKVRLTVPELIKIERHDFSGRTSLEEARDLMVFACWTGLRISDWYSVRRTSVRTRDGQTFIEVMTKKTKTKVVIPMCPPVEKVLDKYDFNLPKPAQQQFNRLIKDVCREVIPESTFTRVYSEAGKTKIETALKCDFVSSHAGRRSFASNLYEATGRAYPIMQITGHKTEAIFQKYVDLKTEETVRTLHGPLLKLASWRE